MLFSIINCTHNPHSGSYQRVLEAIQKLKVDDGWDFEVLVIDNNSDFNIEEIPAVRKILSSPRARLVRESTPGLTNARIRGFRESTGKYLVFFDDDNEPFEDYLIGLKKGFEKNHVIKAVGPGLIVVEFLGKYDEKYQQYFRNLFQERNVSRTIISNYPSGESVLFGTGMAVERDLFSIYADKVSHGIYNASDRLGNSLVSSGDSQIVNTIVSSGYLFSISTEVGLKHLILERKSNFEYAKKLAYSIPRYGLQGAIEMAKEVDQEFIVKTDKVRTIVHAFLMVLVNCSLRGDYKMIQVHLAKIVGESEAKYVYSGKVLPAFLQMSKKWLGLDKF